MVRHVLQPGEMATWRQETLRISLLLLALLVVFFWKAVFLGYKLLPLDIIYTDPVYLCHAPADFTKPHNILLYDQAYQFYPWRVYILQSLKQGTLPFWNPYIYCGTPLLAEDQPAVFYPLNILSYVFSPPDGFLFTAVARLFIAALATYWFIRAIDGSKFAALIGAITFTFSGFMIVWLGHPHTNVAAWLPALFLAVEWLYKKNDVRRIAAVALVIAIQLMGGHAETALYTLTAGGMYYLFRVVSAWWDDRKFRPALAHLLSFVAAAVLGFALASIHLLPFWEWLQRSAEFQLRAGAESLRLIRPGLRYELAAMLPIILPNIFNNPTWPGEYKSFLPGWNFAEQTVYIGIIGLALAGAVIIAHRRERRVMFLTLLGLLTLGAALRLPLFDLINRLPLFNVASPGRFRLIYTFCMSVLTGLGVHDVFARAKNSLVLRIAALLLIFFVVAAIPALLATRWILTGVAARSAVGARQLSPEIIARAFSLSNVMMYWPILIALAAALLLTLHRRGKLKRQLVQVVLLFLVVVDLFAFGIDYHTIVRKELIFPDTPALRFVKDDKDIFRIIGTNIDVMPNTAMVHGLYDVRGLDFPSHRYREFCEAIGGHDWLGYGILFTVQLQPKLLGLLNVKYVLTSSRPGAKALRYLRLVTVDKDINVYQNLYYLPRSFIVHHVRVSGDSQEVLKTLQDPGFDLATEIILEKAPPPQFVEPQESVPQSTAEITRYDPNHVTIRASTSATGFLFISDSYYPDWKAYVDGVEAEIYRADYIFRAVYLAPGTHTVEFVYEPQSFRLASIISLLALLIVVLSLVIPRGCRVSQSANGGTELLR